MFTNKQQLEAACIWHYVNGCDWALAKYFALRATPADLEHVINTHPNWRNHVHSS